MRDNNIVVIHNSFLIFDYMCISVYASIRSVYLLKSIIHFFLTTTAHYFKFWW